jgi:ribonuclease HII
MSPPPGRAPKLVVETGLHAQGYTVVAGVDEVGRGCLSGPVTVGAVVVSPDAARPPRGLRDSKLLTPAARRALVPRIHRWVSAWAVADATAAEIDEIGIIAALRLAGHRALAVLAVLPSGGPDCVLLDGNHDYLTPPEVRLGGAPRDGFPHIRTMIKADLRCASVAAASVLAKTTRDAYMVELAKEHPEYGWEINKGYATPHHRAALREVGPSPYHRVSWRLGLLDALNDSTLQEELDLWDADDPHAAPEDDDVIELDRVDAVDRVDSVEVRA